MKRATLMLAALVLLLCGRGQALADVVLFDGGPPIVGGGGYAISNLFDPNTQPFTLTFDSTLTLAQVAVLVPLGQFPLKADWSIGSTAFGSDIGSGVASLNNALVVSDDGSGHALYESTFTLTGKLAAGTYYLTLTNGSNSGGDAATYWARSGNPALDSESFQIYGNSAAVPEPSSLALVGLGIVGVASYCRRRRKHAPTV